MHRILQFVVLALLVVQGACHRAASSTVLPTLDWQTSPLDLNLRGMNGDRYRFRCPSGKPRAGSVTGSGLYTDASSICGAAVHAGAIDAQRGGIVTIQILPGQPGYHGSMQNFLRSSDYPHPWSGSFAVLATPDFDASARR
ncbi:LCCL domain-containing protein [Rhodanobacter sp. C03]|uniref:LCCL domain-containing protein n=1 Tax=Rhodanobacter sp. C03 TaxID=1945858 RepID=UPI0011157030|nr:LCCL domain-containing protein [Rhodanobacter sp. C03]